MGMESFLDPTILADNLHLSTPSIWPWYGLTHSQRAYIRTRLLHSSNLDRRPVMNQSTAEILHLQDPSSCLFQLPTGSWLLSG